ncbi:MAG: hypothetical protein CM15mP93_17400 [Thiotrichaceae bacterium]|nr:MAG: hypothetical protein CM15mP93_17400 [Thiotrichaceae bacterium]
MMYYQEINTAINKKKVPILVGGTMMYFNTLFNNGLNQSSS